MKKATILFVVLSISLLMADRTYAQSKALNKAMQKQYKTKIKEFKKEGKEVCGSSQSVEVVLLKHYEKLSDENNQELVIVTENCPTENLCNSKSLVDAQSQYATLASNYVKGRTASAQSSDAANFDIEAQDSFFAAYEGLISKNVSRVIKKSFSVCKKENSGYRYETFYLINEEEAATARQKAAEQAAARMEQTEDNIKWAEKVSDYVNERPNGN